MAQAKAALEKGSKYISPKVASLGNHRRRSDIAATMTGWPGMQCRGARFMLHLHFLRPFPCAQCHCWCCRALLFASPPECVRSLFIFPYTRFCSALTPSFCRAPSARYSFFRTAVTPFCCHRPEGGQACYLLKYLYKQYTRSNGTKYYYRK